MAHGHVPTRAFGSGGPASAGRGDLRRGERGERRLPAGAVRRGVRPGALVAAGEREIAAAAVVAERLDICPPCGGCRQRLAELPASTPRSTSGARGTAPDPSPWPSSSRCCSSSCSRRAPPTRPRLLAERSRLRPRVGIVLGSGLGGVADAVEDPTELGYEELPWLPLLASRATRAARWRDPDRRRQPWSSSRAALTNTRASGHRGSCAHRCAPSLLAGAEVLLLTNAAGSLRPGLGGRAASWRSPDHINLTGLNGASLPRDEHRTPASPSMRDADDPELRAPSCAPPPPTWGSNLPAGCLPGGERAELRDPGRDPRLPDAGRRRRGDVDGPRSILRATAACGWPRVGDHQPRGGPRRTRRSATSRRSPRGPGRRADLAPLLVRFVERAGVDPQGRAARPSGGHGRRRSWSGGWPSATACPCPEGLFDAAGASPTPTSSTSSRLRPRGGRHPHRRRLPRHHLRVPGPLRGEGAVYVELIASPDHAALSG